jgi:copper(I)-binding protein
MTLSRRLALGLIGASLALAACNAPTTSGSLRIEKAWARTTAPGATTGAGYLTIVNETAADRLVGASSPVADKVELHESAMDGMVMTMRPLGPVEIKAGETLALAPGGRHLMFTGLKQPLVAGQKVPVTLTFEIAGERKVELEVRNAAPEEHQH